MADMENDSIPTYDIMAPVKSLKVVDKAFELPLVSSAYTEVATLASPITPYVESSVNFITPIVEGGYNTIKEKVMPHLPDGTAESLQSKVNGAVAQLTVAVEKVDTLACGGMDQLLEKVPALKEETPELIKNTKVREYCGFRINFDDHRILLPLTFTIRVALSPVSPLFWLC